MSYGVGFTDGGVTGERGPRGGAGRGIRSDLTVIHVYVKACLTRRGGHMGMGCHRGKGHRTEDCLLQEVADSPLSLPVPCHACCDLSEVRLRFSHPVLGIMPLQPTFFISCPSIIHQHPSYISLHQYLIHACCMVLYCVNGLEYLAFCMHLVQCFYQHFSGKWQCIF